MRALTSGRGEPPALATSTPPPTAGRACLPPSRGPPTTSTAQVRIWAVAPGTPLVLARDRGGAVGAGGDLLCCMQPMVLPLSVAERGLRSEDEGGPKVQQNVEESSPLSWRGSSGVVHGALMLQVLLRIAELSWGGARCVCPLSWHLELGGNARHNLRQCVQRCCLLHHPCTTHHCITHSFPLTSGAANGALPHLPSSEDAGHLLHHGPSWTTSPCHLTTRAIPCSSNTAAFNTCFLLPLVLSLDHFWLLLLGTV